MPSRLVVIFFGLSVVSSFAAPLPLTAKEIGLMLRGGDSNAIVLRELSKRHFADMLDATGEQALVRSGANAELIAALKQGTYSLSPEQSAAAQQQIVDLAKRRAAETRQAEQYQAQVVRERTTQISSPTRHVIYEQTKGDLVRLQNDRFAPLDEDALANKKLIALYFSAAWCGPCRKFTPELVEYYNRVIAQHPDVEIVFVSCDRSAGAMQKYMRDDKMPWPAIDYQKIDAKAGIQKYAGKGIPCLVLIDPTGRVVSHSYEGDKYVGPAKVLADMDTIFAGVAAKKVAATH